MFLTNHSSAFLLHDVRVVKNVASLSSLMSSLACYVRGYVKVFKFEHAALAHGSFNNTVLQKRSKLSRRFEIQISRKLLYECDRLECLESFFAQL